LDQALHRVIHTLTINVRDLAQFYQQYEQLTRARAAAKRNLDQQFKEYDVGRVIFLNVLQAITDWGDAVSAEAQTLIQYNTELANIERQTGTILETHGVRFYEERFYSIGPLGRLHADRAYPRGLHAGPNADRYPVTNEPAENTFDLSAPYPVRSDPTRERDLELLPPVPDPRPRTPEIDALPPRS
jgi:hypothetical protein